MYSNHRKYIKISITFINIKQHWNSFGSLSKSEFSFLSDRSSFAASLNTLSDTNRWIVESPNNDKEKEQKINYSDKNIEFSAISKSESIGDIPAFTFGNSGGPQFSNHISQFNPRKISLSSPSMNKRHSKSANSITFSSTVSLYTDTEKRQNSLLFYDLWGVPATNRSRANSTGDGSTKEQSNCSNVDENEESIGDIDMNMNGGYHNNQNSTSLSGMATTTSPGYKSTMTHTPSTSGFSMTRKPSTLLTGPIKEDQAEEWSDFELLHGDASDPDDDDDDEFDVDADDEDSEYVYNDKDKDKDKDKNKDKMPQTSLKKGSKKLSGGFRYRKRKSTLTADFIFGKTSNNV